MRHDRDILLVDEPINFAEAVSSVFTHGNSDGGARGRAAATAAKYDWGVITGQFVDVLRTTIKAASGVNPLAESPAVMQL